MSGWAEKRRIRRKHRERMEEVIAWLVVPLLIWGILWVGIEVKDKVMATASSALGWTP
jgi:hypothetical protein